MILDALVVAPHPDDAELGMGGTIASMLDQGQRVGILDLTDGEPTPFGSPEIRAQETQAATDALGVEWRENLGLTNRSLEPTLEARRQLAEVIRRTRPRWLFAPYWEDAHPDHTAATALVEAARFWAKLTKTDMTGEPFHPERILYYFCVHLRLAETPSFVYDISTTWSRKLDSVKAYHSQFVSGKETLVPSMIDRIETEAVHWGQRIGVSYGEPFASREPVGVNGFANFT